MAPLVLLPWLLGLLLQLQAGEAKLQAGPLRISGPKRKNHWKYVSKFGFGLGTGTFHARIQLNQPKSLQSEVKLKFEVYLDEDWPAVEALEDVCDRPQHSRQKRDIPLDPTGAWGEWINGTLRQTVRPHIWYFAISDCDGVLQNFTHRLKFEFRARQESGSEFSIEMSWLLLANTLFLLGFTAYSYWFLLQTKKFLRSAGYIHPVIWILGVGVIVHFIAQAFHTLHLFRYSFDGNGIKPLEVLSEILFMLSQVIQTSLLILIALGYTLLQSKIGELDLMIPMCFMVGVIHIMLVGFGKIKDDASYKYHEHEGVIGWILLVIRLLLYAWFLWAVQSSAAEGGMKLRSFLQHFRIAGSAYFLGFPTIFLITKCFAPYLQHSVMSIGLMVMQASSSVWLATLFLTRGEYFKVSTLSASELPGGCKVGMVKEE